MRGETYQYAVIRDEQHEKALASLARMKEIEKQREQAFRKGKLKREVTYDPVCNTTRTHYYV